MAVQTHFGGGISTPIVTANTLSAAGLAIRASLGHFSTKISMPTFNLKFRAIKATQGPAKMYGTPGILAGDVILTAPTYMKFSDGGLRSAGVATAWTLAAGGLSMSFGGILSGSVVTVAFLRY